MLHRNRRHTKDAVRNFSIDFCFECHKVPKEITQKPHQESSWSREARAQGPGQPLAAGASSSPGTAALALRGSSNPAGFKYAGAGQSYNVNYTATRLGAGTAAGSPYHEDSVTTATNRTKSLARKLHVLN